VNDSNVVSSHPFFLFYKRLWHLGSAFGKRLAVFLEIESQHRTYHPSANTLFGAAQGSAIANSSTELQLLTGVNESGSIVERVN
jgi:hypothetical protein